MQKKSSTEYLPIIEYDYFQMDISPIIYLLNKHIEYINHYLVLDLDNLLHDYLIQLRYQLGFKEAKNEILSRLQKAIDEGDLSGFEIYNHIDVLLSSIYYQMCIYGLYNRGELDYRIVKSNTIQISKWQDEYTPIFECVDKPNTTDLIELERFSYLYYDTYND